MFSDNLLYQNQQTKEIIAQIINTGTIKIGEKLQTYDIKGDIHVQLQEIAPMKLAYDRYLFSYGKRKYYELKVPNDCLQNYDDILLKFNFKGSSLQMFVDGKIIDDYFNIDQRYTISLKYYESYIKQGKSFVIKTAPQMKYGKSKVYNECDIPYKNAMLKLENIQYVKNVKVK